MPEVLKLLVDGGAASAGPPLGPALGPLGLNLMDVVKAINEKTKGFVGMKVPVKLIVDTKTKKFELEVGTPPTSSLILKELGLEKGAPTIEKIGDITLKQAMNIAELKKDSLGGRDVKEMVLEVVGTCKSMGVTVEGKDPREIQDEIKKGMHDKVFKTK
ncbi:MAG: 50S ribosomal protein L11 [Thermoplasmata archaeon]|nr:50S ribosomal protein L11 [Thermoplasmata archaeon]